MKIDSVQGTSVYEAGLMIYESLRVACIKWCSY